MLLVLARPEEENKRTNVVGIIGAYEIYSFYSGLPKRKRSSRVLWPGAGSVHVTGSMRTVQLQICIMLEMLTSK